MARRKRSSFEIMVLKYDSIRSRFEIDGYLCSNVGRPIRLKAHHKLATLNRRIFKWPTERGEKTFTTVPNILRNVSSFPQGLSI